MNYITAYIPVCNGAQYLRQSIEALLHQTYPCKEIIVVDDGSSDDSASLARSYPITVISHEHNKGLACARNTALRYCQTEFLASLDVDCVPASTWLEKSMGCFTDKGIAGVGGKISESGLETTPNRWRALRLSQDNGDVSGLVPFLAGANTVFRTADLRAVGGYDEKYKHNFEDIDLCERVRAHGKKMWYCAEAQVFHMKNDTPYSVVHMCWRYRHRTHPRTVQELCRESIRDVWRGMRWAMESLYRKEWALFSLDVLSCILQPWWSIKAFITQTTNSGI